MTSANVAQYLSWLRTIKFMLTLTLAVAAFGHQTVAWAAVGDSMAQMEQKYGSVNLIGDSNGLFWTADEWQALPVDKPKLKCYGYGANAGGMNFTIWAEYDRLDFVKKETVIIDGNIRVRDFGDYFPELYQQLIAPQNKAFIIHTYLRDELGLLLSNQAGKSLFIRFMMDNNDQDKTRINMHSRIKAYEISALSPAGSSCSGTQDSGAAGTDELSRLVYGGTWEPVGNFFRPELYFSEELIPRSKTDMLVIHHTGIENMSLADIHEMHLKKGWAGIGYHKVILPDGTVENGRPENMIGAHALGVNERSIGIVLVGDFETHGPTPEQMKSLTTLTLELMQKYNIPLQNVVPHRDVTPGTICPGPMFPWTRFIQGLENAGR